MRDRICRAIAFLAPYLPVVVTIGLVFLAGCIAHASEPQQPSGTVRLTWETLATMYGPLGFWLIWELRQKGQREEKREKVEEERRKKDEEHRKEWTDLLQRTTEALTLVNTTLNLSRADDDKHRTAIYKLVEEVKEVTVVVNNICEGMTRNTRIMHREE